MTFQALTLEEIILEMPKKKEMPNVKPQGL